MIQYVRTQSKQPPEDAVLVRIYATPHGPKASLQLFDELDSLSSHAPDNVEHVLFRAQLVVLRLGRARVEVLLEPGAVWQADWGELMERQAGPGPSQAQSESAGANQRPPQGTVISELGRLEQQALRGETR